MLGSEAWNDSFTTTKGFNRGLFNNPRPGGGPRAWPSAAERQVGGVVVFSLSIVFVFIVFLLTGLG